MSLEGLKASCIKSGLALVGTDGTVYYCPPEAQLPDALRNALARAQTYLRIKNWQCFRLAESEAWIAIPPSFSSSKDELQFLQRQLAWIEGRDSLSGLMTRSAWHHMPPLDSSAPQLCVYIKVSNLNLITERMGSRNADIVVQTMGGRLTLNAPAEQCFRLSHDVFMLYTADSTVGDGYAEQLHSQLSQTAHLEYGNCELQVVMGLAHSPKHGQRLDILCKHAELAAMAADRQGKAFQYYDEEIAEANRQETLISQTAYKALTNNELIVHYQPQLNLQTGQVCAVEALVRWEHPELGLLGPDAFLDTFEQQNLLSKLTEWLLDQAIDDIQGLNIGLSINVPPELVSERFSRQLIQVCHNKNFETDRLTLELTEQALPKALQSEKHLVWLQQQGCHLAIDDFGVGDSSLARMGQIQFNELKLDRSLLPQSQDDRQRPLVLAHLLRLADDLGMSVVAEGVEEAWQQDLLHQLGCQNLQGFHFAHPMPIENLAPFMAAR